MTEKLKYNVGDKVLIKAEITKIDGSDDTPYCLNLFHWISEEALEQRVVHLPPKPKVTQAVMEYCLKHKDKNWSIEEYLDIRNTPDEIDDWLFFTEDKLKNQHALATLVT